MTELQDIHGNEWDTLVVLDACRYDYFEKNYRDYFDGELSKVLSPASSTIPWLHATWPDYYDLIYLSGNPYVNSTMFPGRFFAKPHFREIVDVWNFGWSDEYHTVPPEAISVALLGAGGHKTVAHYMQPHHPYIGETKIRFNIKTDREGEIRTFSQMSAKLKDAIRHGRISMDTLRQAYEDNLKLALASFGGVVDKLKGRIIVTADHGEFLGEHKEYLFHPDTEDHPILREVPWCVIDN